MPADSRNVSKGVPSPLPSAAHSAINRSDRLRVLARKAHVLNQPASHAQSLLPDFERQDELFSAAWSVLYNAISARAFPAASVAVTHHGRLLARKAFGTFTYDTNPEGAPSLSPRSVRRQGGDFDLATTSTLFDLASLTKVIATTTEAAILYERGLLDLDAPVLGVIPEFLVDSCGEPDPRRREVTFRMLLAHSSGLPAYEKLFLKAQSRDDLLRAAFTMPLSADPGTRAEYSDIGFIILGAALERLAEEPLDIFCRREIFGPLAMSSTTFNPPPEIRQQIPPTADERKDDERKDETKNESTFRNRIIQGEVQDENAGVLGGVAPHAGLFSTAEDLARFAQAIIACGAGAPAREMPKAVRRRAKAKEQRFPEPTDPPPPRNPLSLHPPRTHPRRHLPRPRLGHPLVSFAVRKIFRSQFFRTPRLHRHFALDRSRPPTLHHLAHQPHLARLLQSSHQAGSPQIPRRASSKPLARL